MFFEIHEEGKQKRWAPKAESLADFSFFLFHISPLSSWKSSSSGNYFNSKWSNKHFLSTGLGARVRLRWWTLVHTLYELLGPAGAPWAREDVGRPGCWVKPCPSVYLGQVWQGSAECTGPLHEVRVSCNLSSIADQANPGEGEEEGRRSQ
jgi:hypothetical protein